jgi:heme oxygenase
MILARLKEETRPYHNQLEGDPLSRGILDAELRPAYYLQVLSAYYGLYAPLEARLLSAADWPAMGFDLGRRLKTPLIERDLAAFGLEGELLRTLPMCADLPALTSTPAALGCAYVLEGSTLGGQMIARHVETALGLSASAGVAFFRSYGENLGPMWKEFRSFLEAHAAGHEDAVVAGAGATFGTIVSWFTASYAHFSHGQLALPAM